MSLVKVLRPSKEDVAIIRAIGKKHGNKFCRQIKLKMGYVYIGRQLQFMTEQQVKNIIADLESSGFWVEQKDTCLELAKKGLCDILSVLKRG